MISVCISTYNRRNYLKEAIESVFRQTYKDYEVIVVDDGSDDGTEEMIRSLNRPIRYYRQANRGQPHVYNRLAELARGDYLCFLDSDDIFMDDALERLMAAAGGRDDTIAYGSYIRIDEHGREIGRDKKKLVSGIITEPLFNQVFVHCVATLFPRAAFLQYGGFDSSFPVCYDYELLLRLSLDHRFVPADRPVFQRRRHSTNISGYNSKNLSVELRVLEEFYFTRGGKDRISRRAAGRRLALQACRVGKCALNERHLADAKKYLDKSLAYRFSLKTCWLLLKRRFLTRPSRPV